MIIMFLTNYLTRDYLEDSGRLVSARACAPLLFGEIAKKWQQRELQRLLKEEELRDYASLLPGKEDPP
jgi:hypothetical protein